ncbi:MAG: hypothetical protein HKO66_02460 [Saprospiraceae bacterium]|nr:hypothetical protein [Bacteroidia bacterium]NNE13376.1 hypothetical protein [Saprospiraceae bacterium]NNL91075.1 hypothetical protein [Saprospiraceae bacterium]
MSFINEIEDLIYEEYQELGKENFPEKIRYFEKNKLRILKLPFNICLEIQCDYIFALHSMEHNFKLLKVIDSLITTVITENVYKVNGRDIYKELLFIKAQALYQIVDYNSANHVSSELLKIDPDHKRCKEVFIKNNIDKLRYEGQNTRAFIILMFLLSAIIIGVEILAIRSFYPEMVKFFEIIRNGLFVLGLSTYIFQEFRIRQKAKASFYRLLKN